MAGFSTASSIPPVFYVNGNVNTDITSFLQLAINMARSTAVPGTEIVIQNGGIISGNGIDCTNIVSNIQSVVPGEGLGGGSIIIRGQGMGATRLLANLSGAFPVFDCIGSAFIQFKDFSITGLSTGAQTCAFSGGRQANSLLGDHVTCEHIRADGTYSKCYASMVCDVPRFIDCQFSSSTAPGSGVVWEKTDLLGVGQAFTPLAVAGSISLTMLESQSTFVVPGSRSGWVMGDFAAAYFTGNNYVNLTGTAQHAIELTNGGGCNLFGSMRVESNSTAANQSVVCFNGSSNITGMFLTGNWQLNASGDAAPLRWLVNVQVTKAIIFPDNISNTGVGTLKLTASAVGGTLLNCLLWNPSRLPTDVTPTASIIFGIGGSANNVQIPSILVPDSGILHLETVAAGDAQLQVKGDGFSGDGWLTAWRGAGVTEAIRLLAAAGGGSGLNNLLAMVLQNNGTIRDYNVYDYNGTTFTRIGGYSATGRHPRYTEAANGAMGTVALTAGTATVANTSVTATSRILLTSQADGGSPGFLRVSARTAGTSFTITSSSNTDTSTVAYLIQEPA